MNKTKVPELLRQWSEYIEVGEQISKNKASQSTDGLLGRIKRTTGKPVIFDVESCEKQQAIRNLLCQELPHLSDLINSEPAIMDGYNWTRNDFIELYFKHFRLVIEKLGRMVNKTIESHQKE